MDASLLSKRRLLVILSWALVGLYVFLNFGIVSLRLPLSALLVLLPIMNVLLIVAWFFVRALYNNVNERLKSQRSKQQFIEPKPPIKYGQTNRQEYVPNLKLTEDLFSQIVTSATKGQVVLDSTLKDYLKADQTIFFHSEADYGYTQAIKVLDAKNVPNGISVSFEKLD